MDVRRPSLARRRGRMWCGLCAGLLLLAAPGTSWAGQLRAGLTFKLVEYSDPAFARRGTLTELVYTGKPAPPYGFAYGARFKVNGICRRPNVQLAGGRVRGWVSGYDYGDPGSFSEDLYADAVAIVPYGAGLSDGSVGVDTLCGGRREERSGELRIYRRASDYWWVDNGYYHVVDVLDCSDQLGCQWYAGYTRSVPDGHVTPRRAR